MTATCVTCNRPWDPDLEPSPGEPDKCAACYDRSQLEFAEWLAGGMK